jgi:hypothetical protein
MTAEDDILFGKILSQTSFGCHNGCDIQDQNKDCMVDSVAKV